MFVGSFLLHADRVGSEGEVTMNGTVTFDESILGVMVTPSLLDSSDALLGAAETTYPGATHNRGLENLNDLLTISSNLHTLEVQFFHSTQIDQIRVITTGIPEPNTLSLLSIAVLGLLTHGRRRRL